MNEKKVIVFNDESNSIEICLGDYPALAELKKQELMEVCGLSEEEATITANQCVIDLELFYQKGSGLFGVESGAVESCPMGGLYSPYDGETELIDEEYLNY